MKRLIYVGAEHELRYNKTRAMHQTFQLMPVTYEFVSIEATAKNRLIRSFQLILAYWNLRCRLKDTAKGDVLWLSEFKFSPWHSFLAKCVAKSCGMKLISGPHTVTEDRTLLVDASFQTETLTLRQRSTLFRQRLINGLTILWLDVIQTYTPEYLERIRKLPFARRKPGIIFPIAIPSDTFRAASECARFEGSSNGLPEKIKIAFWGVPTVLHGVDTLLHAVSLLRRNKVPVEAYIFAPKNSFVDQAQAIARQLQIEDCVIFDHITRINENFELIASMDIAVSHLVAMKSSARMRAIIDTYAATNKLLEIWALGLPALVARGAATDTLQGEGCLFVEAGSPLSVMESTLEYIKGRRATSFDRKIRLKKAYAFSPEALSESIFMQLNLLQGAA